MSIRPVDWVIWELRHGDAGRAKDIVATISGDNIHKCILLGELGAPLRIASRA